MTLIELNLSKAKLIKHSFGFIAGRRYETAKEEKTVRALAIAKRTSKALRGETYSPVTEYVVITPAGAGLEYYDTLLFEDGRSLRITSHRPLQTFSLANASCEPDIELERYSAEERTD